MNPLLEAAGTHLVEGAIAALLGYFGGVVRMGKRVIHAEQRMEKRAKDYEERLAEKFDSLRDNLGKGLRLELDSLTNSVRADVQVLKDRLHDLRGMAEDLQRKSGDWTEEAEVTRFVERVNDQMRRLGEQVARIQERLGIAQAAVTARPPPFQAPAAPPRPRPKAGR
jgi:hypothetical protein